MTAPLIEIVGLTRTFHLGGETVTALDGVDLSIEAGEMIAIVGASGSGKSTLMNILGCLDRPDGGVFRLAGQEVSTLSQDELARLRRRRFGFIFQRYHLMSNLTAAGNVEVPAIYAGTQSSARRKRSEVLLSRLGLKERLNYQPNKLSGGQQQRVSIARALMNGGEIILADEPTGALDARSGEAVMEILKELHADGHTVIIVTHDMAVAEQAGRVIEIRQGRIVADRRTNAFASPQPYQRDDEVSHVTSMASLRQSVANAAAMALRSMAAQPLRAALTMLGIVIGIAAVVAVVALGDGSQQRVLTQMEELGASTIEIYPGRDWGDEASATIRSLSVGDAQALMAQPYVSAVSPMVASSARARYLNKAVNVSVNGVGADHLAVRGRKLEEGRMFDVAAVEQLATDAVIDRNTARRLFGSENPLGQSIMVGRVPVTIIGIAAQTPGGGQNLEIFMPYTSVAARISGSNRLDQLIVKLADKVDSAQAERAIDRMLQERHGTKDFFIFNNDQMRKAIEKTSRTMTSLITAVAAIALLVGGIGVMNIMLVSVTERTKEIGLRMAVGARQSDIMLQFLVEATVICMAGAAAGVGLALTAGLLFGHQGGDFPMVFSIQSIVLACAAATLVGLTFGFFPARNAARLDPVDALSRD
ncbi:MacB family efflux pump subunit [Devosia sp. XK-2]|uniref:MacB family efflux pump subunit n=1 Tax=Devosia sp. XK-2 TaxID=3126689 RepID=UPI0030CD3711